MNQHTGLKCSFHLPFSEKKCLISKHGKCQHGKVRARGGNSSRWPRGECHLRRGGSFVRKFTDRRIFALSCIRIRNNFETPNHPFVLRHDTSFLMFIFVCKSPMKILHLSCVYYLIHESAHILEWLPTMTSNYITQYWWIRLVCYSLL